MKRLAICLLLALTASAQHPLTEALQKGRVAVTFEKGRVGGPGAELLRREIASTQFFLLGEEHGTADIAEFATALLPDAWKSGYRHVVMEVGPYSLERLEGKAPFAQVAEFNRRYPGALPFLSWKEEAQFYATAMQLNGGRRGTVWGIDQEFILSPTAHFERLVSLAPNAKARGVAEELLARSRAGEGEMRKTKNPGAVFFFNATTEDFAQLRTAFRGASPAALQLIDALDESREIYRLNGTSGWESNQQRSLLMKRLFGEAYRAAVVNGEAKPKVFVKLGAYHVMRGRSLTGVYDIGTMLPELAAANGTRSFQLLVLPRGGYTNAHRPFSPNDDDKRAPYDPVKELPWDMKPILDAASPTEWSLFDLRPLRVPLARGKLGTLDPKLERLLWGYDAVLIVPEVRAATLFE
ncbi:MAG: hypothetical protein M3Q69_11535 [Acidobacteriota bacterium]|nr:hypothetical protein [Acidobacteriota bacterium]